MVNICSCCNKPKEIVNSHYKLCLQCNETRLKGSKSVKSDEVGKYTKKHISPLKPTRILVNPIRRPSLFVNIKSEKKKTSDSINKDEEFYKECFDISNHLCEECGTPLPDTFRDENGKVNARWRYSHIIPKSIAPELRHKVENINNLCLICHGEWENGNKLKMKIFTDNYKKFPNYLNRLVTK